MNGSGNKLALMMVAVVAVGIFALPSTVSLFAGQHVWYDISGEDKLPCQKCHADIYDEYIMAENGVHGTLSGGIQTAAGDDVTGACYACHRLSNASAISSSMTFADGAGTASIPGEEGHAAAVIACMVCHELNDSIAYPAAGGFNITSFDAAMNNTSYIYSDASHTGQNAAHNAFIAEAINDDTLQDSNEACIACHTWIAVKMNWTHARVLEFDVGLPDDPADITTTSGVHNWSLTNWTVNQTATATVYGNTSGNGTTAYGISEWPGDVGDGSIYEP